MATALHSARTRFFDKCGNPLCGGTVYTYQVVTTTNKPFTSSAAFTLKDANNIIVTSAEDNIDFSFINFLLQILKQNRESQLISFA